MHSAEVCWQVPIDYSHACTRSTTSTTSTLLSEKFVGSVRITLVTILYKKVTTLPINFLRGLSSQEIKKYYVNNFVE